MHPGVLTGDEVSGQATASGVPGRARISATACEAGGSTPGVRAACYLPVVRTSLGSRGRSSLAPALVSFALLAVVSCGGGDDKTVLDATTPIVRSTEPSTTLPLAPPTTSPQRLYQGPTIYFTTEDGWSYRIEPEVFGEFTLQLESSISNSPPGKAQIFVTLDPPTIDLIPIGDTPGREPPQIMNFDVAAYFATSQQYETNDGNGYGRIGGGLGLTSCLLSYESELGYITNGLTSGYWPAYPELLQETETGSASRRPDLMPDDRGLLCFLPLVGLGEDLPNLEASAEADEAWVNAVVSDPAFREQPALVVSFGYNQMSCRFILFPNGEVFFHQDTIDSAIGCHT